MAPQPATQNIQTASAGGGRSSRAAGLGGVGVGMLAGSMMANNRARRNQMMWGPPMMPPPAYGQPMECACGPPRMGMGPPRMGRRRCDPFSGTGNSLTPSEFWTFFVYCLVVVLVVVFFLFYFNRAFATALTWLLNQYTWRRYHAYLEIESLQFALLGGRILFKNVRYHSTNQSVYILKGHLTIRYWLWKTRKEGNRGHANERKSCRIVLNIQGLEWFLYNRTPAYDLLREVLASRNSNGHVQEGGGYRNGDVAVPMNEDVECQSQDYRTSLFRRLLPIQVNCVTGGLVLGNPELESMLVLDFAQANGVYNTTESPSIRDFYRTVLDVTFRETKASLRFNPDYLKTFPTSLLKSKEPNRLRRLFSRLFQDRKREEMETWAGLQRYRDKSLTRREQTQYAKVSQVFESAQADLVYYADVPVGVDEPQWGFDLALHDAIVHYGPWADKQRASIQSYFYPASYRNMSESVLPKEGETRMHRALKINIEFANEATLRIPFREVSKDWRFGPKATNSKKEDLNTAIRPYGWMDLKFGVESFVSVKVPTIANVDGYTIVVVASLQKPSLISSVNYAPMLVGEHVHLEVDMHNPLQWNQARVWRIDMNFGNTTLQLLRDHITLIQDLIRDWNSTSERGSAVKFIPITYSISINIALLRLFLYVNEQNIINNPTDIEDNACITLTGWNVRAAFDLPMQIYEPSLNKISFDVQTEHVLLSMVWPSVNTMSAFMPLKDAEYGTASKISLHGSYAYYIDAKTPAEVDQLTLILEGEGVACKIFGSLVRYGLVLRDNYFGNFTNFVTLDEYRYRRAHAAEREQSEAHELHMKNIYAAEQSSQLEFDELQFELRNTESYMDMHLTTSPITWLEHADTQRNIYGSKADLSDRIQIRGLNVHAHRMYGPRPRNLTFVCDWDFRIGSIKGSLNAGMCAGLVAFIKCFSYNFVDADNSLPFDFANAALPDITYLKLNVSEVSLILWGSGCATEISLPVGLSVKVDNTVTTKKNWEALLQLPRLRIISLAQNAYEWKVKKSSNSQWIEIARAEWGINLPVFCKTTDWQACQQAQQSFVRREDRELQRCSSKLYIPSPDSGFCFIHLGQLLVAGISYARLESARTKDHGTLENLDLKRPGYKVQNPDVPYGAFLRHYHYESREGWQQRRFLCISSPWTVNAGSEEENFQEVDNFVEDRMHSSSRAFMAADGDECLGGVKLTTHTRSRYRIAIESRSALSVILTPFFVKIVQDFIEQVDEQDWNIETHLDALQTTYMSHLQSTAEDSSGSDIALSLNLRRFHLLSIQDTLIAPEAFNVQKQEPNEAVTPDISLVDICLNDANLCMEIYLPKSGTESSKTSVATVGSLDMDRVIANVYHNIDNEVSLSSRRSHSTMRLTDRQSVFLLTLKSPELRWMIDKDSMAADMDLGFIHSEAIAEVIETVLGAVYRWLAFTTEFEALFRQYKFRKQKQVQLLVWQLAKCSQAYEGSDPIFLTKPSNVMRLGARNFRNDTGWKLIAHMRHVMRQLDERSTAETHALLTANIVQLCEDQYLDARIFQDIVRIFAKWRDWEFSEEELVVSPLFNRYFINTSRTETAGAQTPLLHSAGKLRLVRCSLSLKTFSGILRDATQQRNNAIVTQMIRIALTAIPRQTESASDVDVFCYDVSAVVSLVGIKIDANPMLLSFVRHVLRIQRIFESMLRSLSKMVLVNDIVASKVLKRKAEDILPKGNTMKDDELPGLAIARNVGVVSGTLQLVNFSLRGQVGSLVLEQKMAALFGSVQGYTLSEITAVYNPPSFSAPTSLISQIPTIAGSMQKATTTIFESTSGNSGGERQRTLVAISIPVSNGSVILSSNAPDDFADKRSLATQCCITVPNIGIDIPRSVLKVAAFAFDWIRESQREYRPFLESILDEIEKQRRPDVTNSRNVVQDSTVNLNDTRLRVLLNTFSVRIALGSTLSAAYRSDDVLFSARFLEIPRGQKFIYAAQLRTQLLSFHSAASGPKSEIQSDEVVSSPVAIAIPSIQASGSVRTASYTKQQHSGSTSRLAPKMYTRVNVDYIRLNLNVGLLDGILTAQSLIGGEITELSHLIDRFKAIPMTKSSVSTPASVTPLIYSLDIGLKGLKLTAASPYGVAFLESGALNGVISRGRTYAEPTRMSASGYASYWKFSVLSLSIAISHTQEQEQRREDYLANIELDFSLEYRAQADMQRGKTSEGGIYVSAGSLYVIMQPTALGRLADMLQFYQSELRAMRAKRAHELEHLAHNTKLLMTSLDVSLPSYPAEGKSIITNMSVGGRIEVIRVIIPFSTKFDGENSKSLSAFYLEVGPVDATLESDVRSSLHIHALTAEFRPYEPDQSKSTHESAYNVNYNAPNRFSLPGFLGRIRRERSLFGIELEAAGFDLNIDANLIESCAGLLQLYEESMAQINTIVSAGEQNGKRIGSPDEVVSSSTPLRTNYTINASFTCESGRCHVRLVPVERLKSPLLRNPTDKDHSQFGTVATISIPGVEVYMQSSHGVQNSVTLTTYIEPSANTFTPVILEIVRQFNTVVKSHFTQRTVQQPQSDPVGALSLQLCFCFKLGSTELLFACGTSSKVVCKWHLQDTWSVITLSLSNRQLSVQSSLTVASLTLGLRHAYSPESSLECGINGVMFNFILQPYEQGGKWLPLKSLTLVVSRASVDISLPYLQDVITFYLTWFDADRPRSQETEKTSKGGSTIVEEEGFVSLSVIVQQSQAKSDLGPQMGKADWNVSLLTMSLSKLPDCRQRIRGIVQSASITMDGRLLGFLNLNHFFLDTHPVSCYYYKFPQSRSPASNLFLEGLESVLEYEYQKLFVIKARPIWVLCLNSPSTSNAAGDGNGIVKLLLSVTIDGLEALGSIRTPATIKSVIQKLETIFADRYNKAAELFPARKQVMASCVSHQPVSEVKSDLMNRTSQSLPIGGIRLSISSASVALYPSHFYESDCVQARITNLQLMEQFLTSENDDRVRSFNVAFASIAIVKAVAKRLTREDENTMTPTDWMKRLQVDSNNVDIMVIPATNAFMTTEQKADSKQVDYIFQTLFDGKVDVALNFKHYQFIQDMINTFKFVNQQSSASEALDSSEETPVTAATQVYENSDGVVYHAKEAMSMNLQLRVMGDATPPVDWFVSKQRIPGIVHQQLMIRMEKIFERPTLAFDVLKHSPTVRCLQYYSTYQYSIVKARLAEGLSRPKRLKTGFGTTRFKLAVRDTGLYELRLGITVQYLRVTTIPDCYSIASPQLLPYSTVLY
ncbi:hypothetical protein BZG36_03772, partial [Bifiguratus adelaidae]